MVRVANMSSHWENKGKEDKKENQIATIENYAYYSKITYNPWEPIESQMKICIIYGKFLFIFLFHSLAQFSTRTSADFKQDIAVCYWMC